MKYDVSYKKTSPTRGAFEGQRTDFVKVGVALPDEETGRIVVYLDALPGAWGQWDGSLWLFPQEKASKEKKDS